jgi:hypothetical protein
MSQEAILFPLTLQATAAVLADRCVDQDGGYSTAAASSFGITTVDMAINDYAAVSVMGTKIVTAGGVIAKDAYVEVGTDGKVVTFAAGVKVGRCLQAAAADGDKIEILQFVN